MPGQDMTSHLLEKTRIWFSSSGRGWAMAFLAEYSLGWRKWEYLESEVL